MRFAILFPLIALGLCFIVWQHGGWTWVLLWPALGFFVVGSAYAFTMPRVFGKRADGRLSPWSMILLFPFLFYSWGLWHLVRLLHRIHSREAYASEIVPGIWLSRRILRHEVPAGVTCVVDMTCEFPAARGLVKSVACYCVLPTLDYGTPAPREAVALIEKLRGHGGGILVHCAQGHGRSALLAAALLIGLGKAMDADEALAVVKRGRPNARLTPRQMAALREIVGSLAKPGTAVLDEDN